MYNDKSWYYVSHDLPGGKFLGLKIKSVYRREAMSAVIINTIIVPLQIPFEEEFWKENQTVERCNSRLVTDTHENLCCDGRL
jgi:hypothetical protein